MKTTKELLEDIEQLELDNKSWEKEYDNLEEKLELQIDELNTQLFDYEDTDEINKDLKQEVDTLKEEVEELEGEILQQDELIPAFRHIHDRMEFEEMVREFKLKHNYHE